MDKHEPKGEPLGNTENQGQGDARTEGAGDEGGLRSIGNQRGSGDEAPPQLDVDTKEGTPIKPTSDTERQG